MTSQFGSGSKNPPWARQATDFLAASGMAGQGQGLQQQPGLPTNAAMYSYNSAAAAAAAAAAAGLQQQQYAQQQLMQNQVQQLAAALTQQPAMALATTLGNTAQVATVSYPSSRNNQPATQSAMSNQKQRVFTGTVTKLLDNFGFVDEDVFFQTNCVKGAIPKVGDRVLVEASYNSAMPFKWNATRVQVLTNASNQSLGNTVAAAALSQQQQLNAMQQAAKSIGLGAGLAAGAAGAAGLLGGVTPLQLAATVSAISNASNLMGTLASRSGLGGNQGNRGAGMMRGSNAARSNFNETRFSEDRDRGRERDHDRDRREKKERNRRSRSTSPPERRTRSPKRRVVRPPPRYVVQAPRFVISLREASVMTLKSKYGNMYIPSDFFNACAPWIENLPLNRPFGLGQSCRFHIMHKEVPPLLPETAVLDPPDADYRFCAKVMLLTSPPMEEFFSKSCALAQEADEQKESFQHPTRLLQFLVGTRGKNEPMAIGGPWSPSLDGPDPEDNPQVLIKTAIRCTKALTSIDLSRCTQWYRFAEIRYLRAESKDKPARVETVVLFLPDVWRVSPSRLDWMSLQKAYSQKLQKKLNPDAEEPEEEPQEGAEKKKEPTHFSQLDPKTLKLQELRDELDSRGLSSKGLKSQLIARLTKALLMEEEQEIAAKAQKDKEEEEKKQQETEEDEKEKEKKEAAKKKEEEEEERKKKKEKQMLERRYQLPESPCVIVHPSATAKSGKFDCSVMTLSVLLDYRPEDNKEHSFEVSLFAEMFNEMLMRDFGFTIYKSLVVTSPKEEEDKKKDKDKKSDEPPAKKKKTDEKKEEKEGEGEQEMDDEEEKDAESNKDEDGKDDKEKDKKDKDKNGKRDKKKFETVDPALLLACIYYDQNHCGYLQERDLEDIIYSLGLDLSRAQVRKLTQKVVSKETFHYRKLCDQPSKEGETTLEHGQPSLDMDSLARGNSDYLASNRTSPGSRAEGSRAGGKEGEFVTFRGSVIDLESLLDKLDKSDGIRTQLENRLADLTQQLESSKASQSSQETVVKTLRQELSTLQSRLAGEVAQRSSMAATQQQWVTAVGEAKQALQQAVSALGSVVPSVKQEAEQPKEGREKESRFEDRVKDQIKKE